MKKLTCFLTLFLVVFTVNAFAQFEGKVVYSFYEINDQGEKEEDTVTAYITPDRILLQTDESYSMAGSFKSEGLLIRLDKEDFVFLTGDTSAMKITKAEITSFMNMFGSMDDAKDTETEMDFTFEQTGETKDISGYSAQKFIYKNNDEDGKTVVWMTRDLNINWGMLAQPWGDSVSFMTGEDFPTDLIFQEGYFPVKIISYEDGEVSAEAVAHISETNVEDAMVQIPPEIHVASLSEYLFQMMRQMKQ